MSLTNIQSLLRELDMRGALEQFNAYVNNPQELEATSIWKIRSKISSDPVVPQY